MVPVKRHFATAGSKCPMFNSHTVCCQQQSSHTKARPSVTLLHPIWHTVLSESPEAHGRGQTTSNDWFSLHFDGYAQVDET